MSQHSTATPRRGRRALATMLAGALAAGLALGGAALPASAAEADVTGATLDWGFKASFRSYVAAFGGSSTTGDGASTSPAPYRWSTSGVGTFDDASGAADVDFGGSVQWTVPAHGIDITLSNPGLVLAGDGSGELDFDYVDSTGASGRGAFATLTVAGAAGGVSDGVASYSGVPATATALTTAVFGASYPVGTVLDPVSFTLPYEVAVTPEPEPTVEPTATPTAEPTATPTAEPTATPTAEPTATPTPTATPAPVDPIATTLALAATPAAPLSLGSATTLTATVTPTEAGTVEFFETSTVTGVESSLGSAAVVAGSASVTTTLAAGGHSFRAAFTGGEALDSEASITANYGVVDPAVPTIAAPGPGARTLEGVSASWDYSEYSSEWAKTASGDITVDGQTFRLTNGVATYDTNAVSIAFSGSLRVLAYPTMGGFWVDLADPTLAIDSSGRGTWTATVTTVDGIPAQRVVVDTLTGASLPDFSADGSATLALDYAGSTAVGTWSAAYGDAWSNAFVQLVPSSIRAFYYTSSASAAQAKKPASPLALSWTAAEVVTPPTASTGDLVWGFKQSFRSYIGMFGGSTTANSGATVGADGLFTFTQVEGGDYDQSTGAGSIHYAGTVLFDLPAHGFSIALANPWVTVTADGSAVLSAETSTTDTAGLSSLSRIDVATLAVPAGQPVTTDAGVQWTEIPATFTRALQPTGWEQYEGQAADPVSFHFGAAVVVTPEQPVTPTPTVPAEEPVVVVPPAAAAEPHEVCVARAVSGASLTWGVKASFRSYITGPIAQGSVNLQGASSSGSAYSWSGGSGSFNDEESRGVVSYSGAVNFTGHAGKLDLTIANPRVQLTSASSGVLIADVTSKALQGADVNAAGIALATLNLADGSSWSSANSVGWDSVPATLTAAGATAFGGFYQAGAALDDVAFTFPLGAEVACTAATSGPLASTGLQGYESALLLGLVLFVGGAGVLMARRRLARA